MCTVTEDWPETHGNLMPESVVTTPIALQWTSIWVGSGLWSLADPYSYSEYFDAREIG